MRFYTAWMNITWQNITLRVVSLALALCTLSLGFLSAKLALKDPVVIERGCVSEYGAIGSSSRSEKELSAFLKQALEERFNSQVPMVGGLISDSERRVREREQAELKNNFIKDRSEKNKLEQVVIYRGFSRSKDAYLVDALRVLTVGEITTSFHFPLKLKVVTVSRSRNPYGLILEESTVVMREKGKNS